METNNVKGDEAFEGMIRAAYGIPKDRPKEPSNVRLARWSKMSLLDIGKEMYGVIHTSDMRAIRDAYVKGLRHGKQLSEYEQQIKT